MLAPQNYKDYTQSLGDMREWAEEFKLIGKYVLRYDSIIDGEQHSCSITLKTQPDNAALELIRSTARECLKNRQYGEFYER
jgi:hypothetical protein